MQRITQIHSLIFFHRKWAKKERYHVGERKGRKMERKQITKRHQKDSRAKDGVPGDRKHSHEWSFGMETEAAHPPEQLLPRGPRRNANIWSRGGAASTSIIHSSSSSSTNPTRRHFYLHSHFHHHSPLSSSLYL